MKTRIKRISKYINQMSYAMIGMPDYDNYVAHIKTHHPEKTPMTYKEFFKERQNAKYGGKGGFKCC